MFRKAWRLDIYEGRGLVSGQWKTNTQMAADVTTTLFKNKKKESKKRGVEMTRNTYKFMLNRKWDWAFAFTS